jgi:hypothetical protein
MSRVGEGVSSQVNMDPVITPVLDLGKLAKDANRINALMDVPPITAGVSFAQASDISRGRQMAASGSDDDDATDTTRGGDTYIQNLYSPEALDDATIYRRSKSLFSITRGGLD